MAAETPSPRSPPEAGPALPPRSGPGPTSLEEGWLDITVPITSAMPVWPGDPALHVARTKSLAAGDPANVTELRMSAHVGTHLDAPVHFIDGTPGVDGIPLTATLGPARVLLLDDTPEVRAESLARAGIARGERLLLRTRNSERPWWKEPFREDFVALSLEAASLLAQRGVRCVGIDYLSVGGFHADGTAIHRALLEAGVYIIEGLNLSRAPEGPCELLCLPLSIPGADGAPARALMRARAP
jgi:arylformamidase